MANSRATTENNEKRSMLRGDRKWNHIKCMIKTTERGFPGGAVVKNLPANARDKGSTPGPGRSHMPQSN